MMFCLGHMMFCLLAGAHGAMAESGFNCEGRQLDGPGMDLLTGSHLKALELEWAPFATKDPISGNWSGFNIDLFSDVASKLAFTFEIVEAHPQVSHRTLWLQLRTCPHMVCLTPLLLHCALALVEACGDPNPRCTTLFERR